MWRFEDVAVISTNDNYKKHFYGSTLLKQLTDTFILLENMAYTKEDHNHT